MCKGIISLNLIKLYLFWFVSYYTYYHTSLYLPNIPYHVQYVTSNTKHGVIYENQLASYIVLHFYHPGTFKPLVAVSLDIVSRWLGTFDKYLL